MKIAINQLVIYKQIISFIQNIKTNRILKQKNKDNNNNLNIDNNYHIKNNRNYLHV